MARDYKREYQLYHSKPEQIKRRTGRNKARSLMIQKGKVKKGDGKDVDHKNHNTLDNRPSNLRIMSKSRNRSIK
jgi:hypothetical protein